jgi:adenylate cyclase
VAVQPVERKLAAIFAADVAGYSRPKGRDEARTLAQFKACRIIISGLIALHRGRISGPEDMAHLPDGLRLAGLSG